MKIRYDRPEEAWAQLGHELLAILGEKERCYRVGMSPEQAERFVAVRWTFLRTAVRRLVAG